MRVCTRNADGRLLEAQSGGVGQAALDVLISNAVAGGYASDQVTARYATDEEYQALLSAAEPAPDPRLVLDEEERQAAKLDAAILALVNATPAQLITYARNNFPSLTLAEQNKMGMILNVLAVSVRSRIR